MERVINDKNGKNLYKKIREDVELCVGNHIIEQLNVASGQEANNKHFLQDVLDSAEIRNITNIVYTKHENELKFRVQSSPDPGNDDFWLSHGFMDNHNYSAIVRNLDRTNLLQLRLSALDTLLSASVLDTSVPQTWVDLLTQLKYCIVDKNLDVALRSYKIHYKIMSNNATLYDGYVNLLRALTLAFKIYKRNNSDADINVENASTNFIFQLINTVLRMQQHVLRNWSNFKDNECNDIVNSFMQLISSQIQNECNTIDLKPLHWISSVDPYADWFKNLMIILSSRLIVFKHLRNNPSLLKHLVNVVVYNVQNFNSVREVIIANVLHKETLHLATFSHCLSMLAIILKHNQGRNLFPLVLKTHSEPLTVTHFISLLINATNNEYMGQLQRNILIRQMLRIVRSNVSILKCNKNVVQTIFQPFGVHVLDRKNVFTVINNNLHVLKITRFLLEHNALSALLGYFENATTNNNSNKVSTKSRRYVRRISVSEQPTSATSVDSTNTYTNFAARDFIPAQILVELTAFCIRQYIVTNEHNVFMQNVIMELINCCCDVLVNHRLFCYSHIDFVTFMTRLCEFYKCTTSYRFYESAANRFALSRVIILLSTNNNYLNLLLKDAGLLYEIGGNVLTTLETFWETPEASKFILNVANAAEGAQVIAKHHRQLIAPCLMNVWEADEDEWFFVIGSDRTLEKFVRKFAKVVYLLSFSLKTMRCVLLDDDKDTLVGGENEKPLHLSDLIETVLVHTGSGCTETYVGLLTLQILIANNADLLLYLDNRYKLADEILGVQLMNSDHVAEDKVVAEIEQNVLHSVVIDECTLLRQNVIFLLKNLGCPDTRVTENVKNKPIQYLNPQNNSAFKRRLRGSNELQRYLHDYRNGLHDHGWLLQVRRVFKITCTENYKPSMLFDLIEQVVKAVPNKKNNYAWPTNDSQTHKLFGEDYVGINAIVKFGLRHGLIQNATHNEDNLRILLAQSQLFFKHRRSEEFDNFDWFVGVIYLVCSGHVEKTKSTLLNLLNFASAPILWYNCHKQIYKCSSEIYLSHVNHINVILGEFHKLNAAFKVLGIPVTQLIERWHTQCFFNLLDFMEICNYIALCVLYPPEYAAYYNLCIIKHLQDKAVNAINTEDTWDLLKLTQLDGFRLSNYLNSLEKMGKKYKQLYAAKK